MSNREVMQAERSIFESLRCSQEVLCSVIGKYGHEIRQCVAEAIPREYIISWLYEEIRTLNRRTV